MTERLVYVACVAALLFVVGLWAGRTDAAEAIPSCAEDVVLVGTGNFDNGRWDAYVCGPAADDYVGA